MYLREPDPTVQYDPPDHHLEPPDHLNPPVVSDPPDHLDLLLQDHLDPLFQGPPDQPPGMTVLVQWTRCHRLTQLLLPGVPVPAGDRHLAGTSVLYFRFSE